MKNNYQELMLSWKYKYFKTHKHYGRKRDVLLFWCTCFQSNLKSYILWFSNKIVHAQASLSEILAPQNTQTLRIQEYIFPFFHYTLLSEAYFFIK